MKVVNPACPKCNSADVRSSIPYWRCRGCGHMWLKTAHVKPAKPDPIIEQSILKQPVGLTSLPEKVVRIKTDKTLIAMFDQHLDPFKEPHPSFQLAMQFTHDMQPDIIVLGGDWCEFASVSAWEQKKNLLMEGRRYKLDIEIGKKHLRELRKKCPKAEIYFFEGNHEYRVTRYIEENAQVAGLIDVRKDLEIDHFDMKWVPYNEIIRIGKLNYLHGTKWNKYFARSTLEMIGQSCMFGHAHQYQIWTQRLRYDQEPHIAIGMPALTDQAPAWKRGELTNWMNGFAVVEYREGGLFNVHVLPVVKNSVSYGGKTWRIK